MRESNSEPLHGASDVDLALALAQVHDAVEDILQRFDSSEPVSRHAGADVLAQLEAISDVLFNRDDRDEQ